MMCKAEINIPLSPTEIVDLQAALKSTQDMYKDALKSRRLSADMRKAFADQLATLFKLTHKIGSYEAAAEALRAVG